MSLAERAYNVRTLGWRMWLRCELRNIALVLRLTDNQMVFPVSGPPRAADGVGTRSV